jgi:hypothetical protein
MSNTPTATADAVVVFSVSPTDRGFALSIFLPLQGGERSEREWEQ